MQPGQEKALTSTSTSSGTMVTNTDIWTVGVILAKPSNLYEDESGPRSSCSAQSFTSDISLTNADLQFVIIFSTTGRPLSIRLCAISSIAWRVAVMMSCPSVRLCFPSRTCPDLPKPKIETPDPQLPGSSAFQNPCYSLCRRAFVVVVRLRSLHRSFHPHRPSLSRRVNVSS